jgi:hypothetical protein
LERAAQARVWGNVGPAYFMIAILGCGEADAACEPVRTLAPRYESQADCTAATEEALLRHGEADYPVVVAECVAAGAQPAGFKANEVLLPDPVVAPLRTASADGVAGRAF